MTFSAPWTDRECQQLTELVAAKHRWRQIGDIMGRTRYAVRRKYFALTGAGAQPFRRWTEKEREQAIALYQDGLGFADIGIRLGRSRSSIRQAILRQEILTNHRWTEAEEKILLEMAAEDKSYEEIGARLGRSLEGVRNRLLRNLCPQRLARKPLARAPRKLWTKTEVARALELHFQGVPNEEIGKELGRTAYTVHRKVLFMLASSEEQEAIRKKDREKWQRCRESERRQLFAGALDQDQRNHRNYDAETDNTIRQMFADAKIQVKDIAEKIGRTVEAIYVRAHLLGVKRPRPKHRVDDEAGGYTHAELVIMDKRFCAAMRQAIDSGLESAPIGVNLNPCTKAPIRMDRPSTFPFSRSVAGELTDV
jgi:hypothetical protein